MRCLRQADVVLLVARAGSRPGLGEMADELTRRGHDDLAREELVLLHETRDRSWQGTEDWIDIVPVAAHHHVALDGDDDFDRLARTLTGRAVGVVLGGGGARGFAHIGVLRALVEAGIPVVAGTSMGSTIAAQHALGLDYDGMLQVNREGWIKGNPLKDRTLPTVAMLRGRKLERMLETMFGETRIEDLWVRFFCVSSNLSKAELIVHQEGSLKRWVQASMAIPGVTLPVCHEGDLISDGGVLNNLPGDVMRTVSGGTVVAVDVSPREDLALDARYATPPASWSYLWNRMRPSTRAIPLPNIVDIMMRTAMLSSVRMTNVVKQGVDLYIRPPIDQFELFEWKSLDQIAEAGYHGALETIAAWQAAESAPVQEAAEPAVAPG
jgi:NTE family protein/lysophospholipid hydrolase